VAASHAERSEVDAVDGLFDLASDPRRELRTESGTSPRRRARSSPSPTTTGCWWPGTWRRKSGTRIRCGLHSTGTRASV